MPSTALSEYTIALDGVEELIAAHKTLTGGTVGAPKARQGAATARAAVVLLTAALEGYVEDLCEEAIELLFAGAPSQDRSNLKQWTVGNMANPSAAKVDQLFFPLGLPWITAEIGWQKFAKPNARKWLKQMIDRRNAIAHGDRANHVVQIQTVRKWYGHSRAFGPKLEQLVAAHITAETGNPPNW
jgi:hypothetical protein